ncbi:MAG TPA: NDP-hexose 2,3-dehydratase family protein, partial [Pseudoneobacillus sp.]|nr:NDP-hexose 2,3-dehydratase family protein [Pseudoneobacillus sp.]
KKSLTDLSSWNISDDGVFNKSEKSFEVLFCDIEIEGREVTRWDQPLLKPKDMELIIFLMKKINGVPHFLIRLTKEYGIYDGVEIGASMHIAKSELDVIHNDEIKNYLIRKYKERTNIVNTSLLSEEGGRFYHEQNLYLIIQADEDFNSINVNNEYFWVTLGQLNYFIQSDNFVNIQARNLFTLIKLGD